MLVEDDGELAALARELDAIDEPLAIGGAERLRGALTLSWASGGRARLGERGSLEALLDAAEPAPFGDGRRTRRDRRVRDAVRLVARGQVDVEGFDPRDVLARIEPWLSPCERLRATLTDVLIYGPGGHFARHRDTPREADMVGTLVVCLPVAFEGGELRLVDGPERMTFDWAAERDGGVLRWAAFHGDVEHEVLEVRRGHRVTLSYALRATGEPRVPDLARWQPFREAFERALADEAFLPWGGELLIPCARRVIAASRPGPLSVRQLRGADRELASLLESLRMSVAVRPCLVVTERVDGAADRPLPFAEEVVRLRAPLEPGEARRWSELVTLAHGATGEDGEALDATSLADVVVVDDGEARCLARERAATTFLREAELSSTGYFGNEASSAWIYSLVAIEIEVRPFRARAIADARVAHAKYGEGTVLSEDRSRAEPVFEVRFDDGITRKLLERFLRRV